MQDNNKLIIDDYIYSNIRLKHLNCTCLLTGMQYFDEIILGINCLSVLNCSIQFDSSTIMLVNYNYYFTTHNVSDSS